uniref:Uncharacterized protein n=1 Tax=Anopheles quadriannulatus TaxID=34691 RepID=A0A182XT71_ANOQN
MGGIWWHVSGIIFRRVVRYAHKEEPLRHYHLPCW